MDPRHDHWDRIIDGGLNVEVEGELPHNFADLVQRRLPARETETKPRTWIWLAAGAILSLLLFFAHLIIATSHYRAIGKEMAELLRGSRIDLMTAALVAVVAMEVVARTLIRTATKHQDRG